MALVVILRNYKIELTLERAIEHGIAGDRAFDVDAFLPRDRDRRLDAFDFLTAENAAFAAVRIESRNGDARFVDAELAKMLMPGADGCDHPFDGRPFGGICQG